ncbi:uncharacterized protein T551_02812 [Pneumocystis jirovecii RU7]|uniref:Uncharacterized protein n=1 Tax=Pneumocystis jirovecii (strain RU7) TaxID=1408657 RepID=A0A0W4ZHJ5_PNEJ7|nr:uncharacterized protein T551_02812 [Pneumocystis jirovecii RU7]KTW27845.1 hypothetical protein T551_02812 [Pneumocystis jirovecii RU7]
MSMQTYSILSFFVIVPGISYFYIWTFFIATFVESNFFAFIVLLSSLYYGGKYLEKSWGSKGLMKFILVIVIVPNIFAWTWYYIRYIIEHNMLFLCVNPVKKYMIDKMNRTRSIHGGYALYSGFLVALKQLIPEHTITLFKGILRIRIKYVPILYICVISIIGILIENGSLGILAWTGFLSSWVYLRFFKWNTPNLFSHLTLDLRGDTSETFGFAYFFPQPIHSLISMISKKISHFLAFFHIYVSIPIKNQQTETLNSFQKSPDFLSHLGTSRSEAERRRALALKELEERLNTSTNTKLNIQSSTTESTVLMSELSNKPLIINDENKK